MIIIAYLRPCISSLRNVESSLDELGVEINQETVRSWRRRFGTMVASEIRKRRIEGLKSRLWRRHLDEILVKFNGERHCLRRALGHEAEGIESFVTKTRDKTAALK